MFDPVDPRQSFPDLERGILQYWKEEDTFKRSIKERSGAHGDVLTSGPARTSFGTGGRSPIEKNFSFYDGPPFATGLPHYGHLLAGTVKDVIPRYQTMKGHKVQRRFGWDCHGLPVEYEIEKEHKIGSKKDIEEMGVKAFNDLCRGIVQRYTKEWRTTVERMGRWVDMDWDYRTMDPEYMESIWWVFKSLNDKKLIYEGHKPMHVCPRCQTPLSNFEVTLGYKDVTDESATAMFKLEDEPDTYILAWTTTPWTLPGNLFLAVNPTLEYVKVKEGDRSLIVSKEYFDTKYSTEKNSAAGAKSKSDHTVSKPFLGKEVLGKKYESLFPYFADRYKKTAFRIVEGDFVTTTDGTGVVHIAPGFGEDDYAIGQRENVPLLQHVGLDGKFTNEVTDFAGMDVKAREHPTKTDHLIIEWLKKHDRLFSTESYRHSYPHCWRCDSPLLNYATSSWFVKVEQMREKMLEVNAETQWVPDHLRDGRFGKWLEGARDWAISRNRYWGTPLPIWRQGPEVELIGSRDDLMAKKRIRFTKVTILRHGESVGNTIPIYQGKIPGTDLTERGQKQASAAGQWLTDKDVTLIYASPLARTQQTAKGVADHTDAQIVTDERLREVSFGKYERTGVDLSDLAFLKARRAHKLQTGQIESIYHFEDMESWQSVYDRISDFLRDTLPKHRGDHIVIVTHADPVQAAKHFFTKEDPFKLSHQPYPDFASPISFFWDHDTQQQMDLHKENVDEIRWPGSPTKESVEVTLVRHGETDWNKNNLVQGSGGEDVPLNDTGRKQANDLATTLSKEKFDVIISSDLSRARETAEILAAALKVPHAAQWKELRERDCGEWNGKPLNDVMTKHRNSVADTASFHYETPKGGESFSAFLLRLEQAMQQILAQYPGKKILVVAHGGSIRGLRCLMDNSPYKECAQVSMKNAEAVPMTIHPFMRRIPDVLDCWFESGSMPYAQGHYPFEFQDTKDLSEKRLAASGKQPLDKVSLIANRYPLPAGFPADFIAENLDQTRGWFYTLTVLSTALFNMPAFKHCICGGIILAEDGKKMSKRLKNYPDPMEVMERHGADALRFALMSSPVVRAETLRFSEQGVKEAVQTILLPLWNTYSFFVTYANAAKFEPDAGREKSLHPLDVWLRTAVQDLVNRMTGELDNYDLSATCGELHETIDALTNWYVRLSRRRFAGKSEAQSVPVLGNGAEADQLAALSTLYDALITLSQLLAPFCPFITEAIYVNLVRHPFGSIHLTDWPTTQALTKEELQLLEKTNLLRMVVSLGQRIRSEKKLKIRQPLASATIAVPPSVDIDSVFTPDDRQLLMQELNVLQVLIGSDAGKLAEAYVQVDARKVGPRLGGRVQEIIKAGKAGEFSVEDTGEILILDERLTPDEAKVIYRGKEGQDVAAAAGVVVSLDTAMTDELLDKGLARDLIRAIQSLRKEQGYSISDRVVLNVEGADDLLKDFSEMIEKETNVKIDPSLTDGMKHDAEIGDERKITIIFPKK